MSRFVCPSSDLDLRALIYRTQQVLWGCLVMAILMHTLSTQFRGLREEMKAVKPLTTQFIKRQPRLTKPLELKKKPRPKRRTMQRRMVSVQARVSRQGVSGAFEPVQTIRALAKPAVQVGRGTSVSAMGLEPAAIAEAIEGSREPKNKVDMSLEMVDIDALDTGQYQAMVIQDPSDKRNVKGFFHLAIVYSVSMRERAWHTLDSRARYGLYRLVEAMNRYTQIRSDIAPHTYTFDSREMMKTPWIYGQAVKSFQPTESEVTNLGTYLMVGGFFFMENIFQDVNDAGERSLRQMVIDALATQGLKYGKDWQFDILPNDHPLFHCFFDFDGAPMGRWWKGYGTGGVLPREYLEGVYLDKRLAVIYTNMAYANAWGDWGPGGHPGSGYKDLDPTRQFQFGVNLLVFALTQEGSITNRVMNAVQ